MIERHQEADILRSLAEAYQEIIERNEQNAGKLGADNLRKAVGRRAVGMGGAGFHGQVYGMGKDKKAKNNPSEDDKRAAKQKDQAKKDRDAENKDKYGISPSERKARAAKNKENKAKAGIDDLLKDIRGGS